MNTILEPASPKAETQDTSQNIRREMGADGICTLIFDRANSSANLFDEQTLHELDRHLDWIAAPPGPAGVILYSAKPSIFIAGADLHALMDAAKRGGLRPVIELGQRVFSRLASLPIPTVAAIHGACAGGGYEVSLACDYRVASPDEATRIGLPETQLGILPGWGGCSRLPRLIGLPAALKVILKGSLFSPRQALKYGMIDALAPRERLLDLAKRKIAGGKPHRPSRRLTNNRAVARAIATGLRPLLSRKTRGHYPAQTMALETVSQGVSLPLDGALALEREAILKLAGSEVCRNLVGLFFLQERARKSGVSDSPGRVLSDAAVIGAGVMGSAITQWLTSRGMPVLLRDIDAERVGHGMANIARLYEAGTRRHKFTSLQARNGLDRVSPIIEEAPLRRADLVIEAAVEKMAVKKEIFARLEAVCDPRAILATNTSALSISEIASGLADPGRVIGLHFFNPVHRMKLVEVVAGERTDPAVIQTAVRFVRQVGKLPVIVRDSPGFLVNRILIPYLVEAGNLFESGARVKDVDEAMLDFGMPMGPLRLLDEVGLDVATDVAETLSSKFSRIRVPAALEKMRDAGFLGRKNGLGFYDYKTRVNIGNARLSPFRKNALARDLSREELQKRMVFLMINEAVRCLEEKVVAAPEDVDFGMVMGSGFAPFRGGPLRYADSVGAVQLVAGMDALGVAGDPKFLPCELLRTMAGRGSKFYENES